MKIALVVGHHKYSKGAYSPHLKVSEWDFYNDVVSKLKNCVDVFHHNYLIPSYTQRVKETASRLNKENYDLVICLHFNAASHPDANGCETLYYYNSLKGKEYAQRFSDTVHEWTEIKLRNNGLKALVNTKDRGFAAVYYPKAPTILIEPFFGTSLKDCDKIQDAAYMGLILDNFIDKLN